MMRVVVEPIGWLYGLRQTSGYLLAFGLALMVEGSLAWGVWRHFLSHEPQLDQRVEQPSMAMPLKVQLAGFKPSLPALTSEQSVPESSPQAPEAQVLPLSQHLPLAQDQAFSQDQALYQEQPQVSVTPVPPPQKKVAQVQTDRRPEKQPVLAQTVPSNLLAEAESVAVPSVAQVDALKQQYLQQILQQIQQQQRYPVRSKRRGEAGLVEVWLEIDAKGFVQRLVLQASSGYPRLDQEAQRMVQVARLPEIPSVLGLHRLQLSLPIVFQIRD